MSWLFASEGPLKNEIATQSSISAWEILWTEQPGGKQSVGSQTVRRNLATKEQQQKSLINPQCKYIKLSVYFILKYGYVFIRSDQSLSCVQLFATP